MRESDTVTAAIADLNRGKVFESISRLKQVPPENRTPQAYFYLSGIYTEMGRYDTAYRYLNSAMKGNPPQGAHYHQLGLIRRYEGCRPEAIAAFTYALKLGMGKEEATLWRHVGDVLEDLLERDKAMDAYRNALRIRPDDAGSHLALGKLHLDRNDAGNAIPELRTAMEISPALPGLHAALGRAYRAAGDSASAIAILTKGIERDSSDQDSRYILAQILLATGRAKEGREALEEYQRLQERVTRTNTTFETAVGLAQAGDLSGAEKALRDVLDGAPRYASALQILGTVLLNRGRLQPALEAFSQARAANPLNPETYFNMGAAYLRSGKGADALEMTQKALVIEDEDARFYAQLSEIYSRMNRQDESRTALERAAELKSVPGYRPPDPYGSEKRRRDDAATVRQICDGPPSP
jgi:tetratricopeptide (TPR) repeat protein